MFAKLKGLTSSKPQPPQPVAGAAVPTPPKAAPLRPETSYSGAGVRPAAFPAPKVVPRPSEGLDALVPDVLRIVFHILSNFSDNGRSFVALRHCSWTLYALSATPPTVRLTEGFQKARAERQRIERDRARACEGRPWRGADGQRIVGTLQLQEVAAVAEWSTVNSPPPLKLLLDHHQSPERVLADVVALPHALVRDAAPAAVLKEALACAVRAVHLHECLRDGRWNSECDDALRALTEEVASLK